MLLKEFCSNANWLAIGVAALAYFILGAIWYSPMLFAKPWMAGHNMPAPGPEAKKKMPMMMIMTFLMSAVMAIAIGMLVMALGSIKCLAGIKLGCALSAIGIIPLVMSHMYTGKSLKLWIIDAAYHGLGISLMSIIISVWHK